MRPVFSWSLSSILHALAAAFVFFGLPFVGETRESAPVNVVPVEITTLAEMSDVRAIAPEIEEEETAPLEEESQPEVPDPAPAPSPAPQQRRQEPRLNLAELQQDLLEDRSKQRADRTTPRRTQGDRGERPRPGAGLSQGEVVALRDRFAAMATAHIERHRCWRAPVDAPDPERLAVVVRVNLDPRGRVQGRPQLVSPATIRGDPELRVAVDRAIRAVLQCDPFPFADDSVASRHYDLWRELEINFDPTEMAG